MGRYDEVVSTVGTNPLPIYFGIRQFCRQGGKAVLVCSQGEKGTEKFGRRIAGLLECFCDTEIVSVASPYRPDELRAVFDGILAGRPSKGIGMNITGGTKMMSSCAMMAWQHSLGDAFYLEDLGQVFRFGDGTTKPLTYEATWEEYRVLHDIQQDVSCTAASVTHQDLLRSFEGFKSGNDVQGCLRALLETRGNDYGKRVREKTEEFKKVCSEMLTPETAAKWSEMADNPSSHATELKPCFKYLTGAWLEELTLSQIFAVPGLVKPDACDLGAQLRLNDVRFELDIVCLHNKRLRLLSCSTVSRSSEVKGKVFEAVFRSRQVGGDMAKVGVVCMAKPTVVGDVMKTVADTKVTVFGIADLENWVAGNRPTLIEFLTD